MTAAVGLIVLAALVWGGANRARWVAEGTKVRTFQTHLSPTRVRQIFSETVVRTGWQFVGDGKPLVAERRIGRLHHQIAISIRLNTYGGSDVRVGPRRFSRATAPAVAWAVERFMAAVQTEDPHIEIVLHEPGHPCERSEASEP